MDENNPRTALRLEIDLTEEEKNSILKEKYSKNILKYVGNNSRGRPMTHRSYTVFYGKKKQMKKKIYARSVEEAVEIFKNENNYVPKFARDHWYKEVWTDYSNDKATTKETEDS